MNHTNPQIPGTNDPSETLRALLQECNDNKVSDGALASAARVTQPTVQRFRTGKQRGISYTAGKRLEAAAPQLLEEKRTTKPD